MFERTSICHTVDTSFKQMTINTGNNVMNNMNGITKTKSI